MTEDDPQLKTTVEELHDRLRLAVEAIESGDQWRVWLDFAHRLHRYSFNNIVLIMTQRPDATAVAGYTTWQSARRQVRRGERSIKIMAPILRRSPVVDEQGDVVRGPDGRKRTRQEIAGYRSASVFDVSQTNGPPLPEQQRPGLLAGEAPAGLWDALARELAEHGYRLLRAGADQLGSANGMTIPSTREVVIRDDVDNLQATKTLAHELAHVVLHADDDEVSRCRGVIEVEAESVAYLVLAAHGAVSDAYSFPYVSHWAYPLAAVEHVPMAEIVTRTGQRVMDAARMIIEATQDVGQTHVAAVALAQRVAVAAERTEGLREEVVTPVATITDDVVLRAIVADSHTFFVKQTSESWVPGYLHGRGLGGAVGTHEIGYAPSGWTALTDHLRQLGYGDDHIESAGVAVRAKSGQLVDRLRDRLTIPLRNEHGSIVGFTARTEPGSTVEVPKYLNTPTTPIFRKGNLLYGLAEHHQELQSGHRPVLCEGALDAIAIDVAAATEGRDLVGVAPCGTALTKDQAELLLDRTTSPTVALAYDGDGPGRVASERAWLTLTESSPRNVVLATMPEGADPADLVSRDPSRLTQAVLEAPNVGYVLANHKISDSGFSDNVPRQLLAFRELIEWWPRLPEGERVPFALHVARRLGIDPVDAAHEIAESQPGVLMEATSVSVLRHCRTISAALDGGPPPLDDDRPVVNDVDHQALTTR